MKSDCSGLDLSAGFPNEFGEMLNYSRSLKFDQLPDYGAIRRSFTSLAAKLGYSSDNGPLKWTPCYPETANLIPEVVIPHEEEEDEGNGDDDDSLGENSYYEMDIDIWERQGERDKDVTLSAKQEAELDSIIPLIIEVQDN